MGRLSVFSAPSQRQENWQRLASRQDGLLATEQFAAAGVTRDALVAHLEGARWQRVLPRVYATYTGPLPRRATITAALLYAGPFALVSHETAAEEWGMLPRSDGPVHVTVPYNCSAVSQLPLVIVHRSRAFAHIAVWADRPRTSRADTVIDLAVAEPTARRAMRRLVSLVTNARIPVREVERRIEERRPRRYGNAIGQVLRLLAEGVQSPLEELFATEVERAHGLPSALRQQPFIVDGKTLWEDAIYDHVGIALTVRLDGRRHHSHPEVAFRDRRRDNAAELAGRSRLVYGWRDVASDPCAVADEVLAVLRRHGWCGPARTCRECGWVL